MYKVGMKTRYKDKNGLVLAIGDTVVDNNGCYWKVEHSENPEDCPVILTKNGNKGLDYKYPDEIDVFIIQT